MPTYFYNSGRSNYGATIAYIILSPVILLAICIISYCVARRVRKGIIRELQSAVAPPAPNLGQVPTYDSVQVSENDVPTMEKFIRKMADEKPVRFTALQLNSFTRNYSKPLGSGGFGVVYKGQFSNGVNVAVKVLKRSWDRRAEEQFMAEVGTIGRTYHINLVKLFGFCYDKYMSALVFEYMENRSLDKYLFSTKQEIEWEKLHDIAVGTAKGLAYLHEECQQRIIHYDIKPANILLDANFLPKVGDFGLAKLCNRDSTHVSLTSYRGTPGYSAPEFFLNNYPITHKCDVYSFGMVLFEIVGRRRNFSVTTSGNIDRFPQRVWKRYENGDLAEMIRNCGFEEKDNERARRMCEVALWCIQDPPDERPPMSAVVKMLEGGVEIMPPAKPFHYLNPTTTRTNAPDSQETDVCSDYSTTNVESNSYWYKKATPIMEKYEMQMASS